MIVFCMLITLYLKWMEQISATCPKIQIFKRIQNEICMKSEAWNTHTHSHAPTYIQLIQKLK